MKIKKHVLAIAAIVSASLSSASVMAADLELVAKFEDARPGNPTLTVDGKLIVTMSALVNPDIHVREVLADGSTRPYPNLEWAGKAGEHGKGIASTIGIKADTNGILWVLDMGNKQHTPKLIGWDTYANKLHRSIVFPSGVVDKHSFIQDIAIDTKRNRAYLADMTLDKKTGTTPAPAILVVDLETGEVRRTLENHESFQSDGKPIFVEGRIVAHSDSKGDAVYHQYGLNPIAIDPQQEWVYFGPMGGTTIHRIPADALADDSLNYEQLSGFIEFYRNKPRTDGFTVDAHGDVYVTDVENSAIGVVKEDGYHVVVQDEKLSWPDGVALSQDGWLYVVANQLHNLPGLNQGKDASKPPFTIYKINVNDVE
ncbi:periplasmic protein [Pseudoalteromonas sp. MM1]|uniref:L-dopachrome tautomerase-related protein n=1 Tax=Pseudoalteromonas sp. MM1 TaxID=3036714 RepID=UPI00257405A8|nr:L-dopachrome tautomerase-related protein [Pseudoalteromonas sp. MM1]BED87936.1 periplasmic protein [Pseudoalteromonas sp. MM1]